ncbi:MAG: hypothetical protein J6A01_03145 [Proteobacteria bacterium]|nr:hypothetical protein [Pseudomonadota bacterium]
MHTPKLLLIPLALLTGCATTSQQVAKPTIIVETPVQTQQTDEQGQEPSQPKGLQIANVQPIANRVEWPEMPTDPAVTSNYRIESGVEDMVWVEGKGYFKGSLQEVYDDLTNPMVIGPIHMTKDIVQDQLEKSDQLTTYVMHVKVKYILTVEFDLSATLEPLYEGDTQVGWIYQNEKSSGSSLLSVISTYLVVKALDNGWFSVEFLSLNKAAQNKESESRGHLETLFSYWEEASKTR